MKSILPILLGLLFISWGNMLSEKHLEKIFEFTLPQCYIVLDASEEKFDYNPHTIIELQFEKDCMWKMYKEQMTNIKAPCFKYYSGTTYWGDPVWHSYNHTAIMYLNFETKTLHFEDYDE